MQADEGQNWSTTMGKLAQSEGVEFFLPTVVRSIKVYRTKKHILVLWKLLMRWLIILTSLKPLALYYSG